MTWKAHGRIRREGSRDRPRRRSADPGHPPRPAAEGHRGLPVHHRAALGLAREVDQRRGCRARRAAHHHARRAEGRAERDAAAGRPLRRRHRRRDHADAEAPRRPHPPARPGPLPRADRLVPRGRSRTCRPRSRGSTSPRRRRSCAPENEALMRSVKQNLEKSRVARQEHLARGHGHRGQPRRPGAPGRPRGLEPRPRRSRTRRGSWRRSTPIERLRLVNDEPRQGNQRPDDAAGDLDAGPGRDGQVAARVLPAPAAARRSSRSSARARSSPRRSTNYRKIDRGQEDSRRRRRPRSRSRSSGSSAATPTPPRPRSSAPTSTG